VRLSPDGRRIATDQTDADGRNIDLWIYDLARNTSARLTFDAGLDQTPVWSSDGRRILFSSNRRLGFDLFVKNSDGSGADQRVLSQGDMLQHVTWDWSRDGKYLLTRKNNELWYLTWSDLVPKPLAQGKFAVRNAQFSPDGRWFAYATNETGNWEIYVSPFPSLGSKWQVSTNGGQEPKWRGDGKELFYLSVEGQIMSVVVAVSPSFQAGTPNPLFQIHRRQPVSAQDLFSYDVSADGQRFLVISKVDEGKTAPLSVFFNWQQGIE
jgi:Tol biopolymer transport system component